MFHLPVDALQCVVSYIPQPRTYFTLRQSCSFINDVIPGIFTIQSAADIAKLELPDSSFFRNLRLGSSNVLSEVVAVYLQMKVPRPLRLSFCRYLSQEDLLALPRMKCFGMLMLRDIIDSRRDVKGLLQAYNEPLLPFDAYELLFAAINNGVETDACLIILKKWDCLDVCCELRHCLIMAALLRNGVELIDYIMTRRPVNLNKSLLGMYTIQIAVQFCTFETLESLAKWDIRCDMLRYRNKWKPLVHVAALRADIRFLILLEVLHANFYEVDFYGTNLLGTIRNSIRSEQRPSRRENLMLIHDYVSKIYFYS
jgi:hypothetical protein